MTSFKINTLSVYALLMAFYVWSISIEGIFHGEHADYGLTSYEYMHILLLGLVALLAFVFSFKKSWLYRVEAGAIKKDRVNIEACRAYVLYLLVIWMLIVALSRVFGEQLSLSFSSYEGNVVTTYGDIYYKYYKFVFYTYTSILASLLLSTGSYALGVIMCSILFFLGVYTYDRDPIVLSVLALALIGGVYDKEHSVVKLFILMFAVYVLSHLSLAFSYYRSGYGLIEAMSAARDNFSFGLLDPAGPYRSIVYVVTSHIDISYGRTYLDSIVGLVPTFIYPDRPEDTAVKFAADMIQGYHGGVGLGFSPIAEAIVNFSTIGIVFQFVIFAVVFGACWKFIYVVLSRITPIDERCLLSIYRVIGTYLLILSFRSQAFFFIKSLVYIFLPLIAVSLVWWLISEGDSRS